MSMVANGGDGMFRTNEATEPFPPHILISQALRPVLSLFLVKTFHERRLSHVCGEPAGKALVKTLRSDTSPKLSSVAECSPKSPASCFEPGP